MSSILKALKKIEDNSRPEVDIQSWPNRIDVKEIVTNSRRNVRFTGKLFIFSLIVATVVFLVWFGADRQVPVAPLETDTFPAGGKTISEGVTAANNVFEGRKEAKRSEATIHIVPEASETSPMMGSNESAMIHAQDRTPTHAAAEKGRAGLERRVDKELSEAEEKQSTASLGLSVGKESATGLSQDRHYPLKRDDGRDASVPANTNSVPAKERLSIRRLEDSSLRLQAITWAKRIENRFALINNQIIRIGEPIGDFSIADIEEDYVILQKGNERWRLEFRLR